MLESQLRAYLFGSFSLLQKDGADLASAAPVALPSSAIARSLLAYLLLNRNNVHSRSVLVGTFWPDQSENRARRALTQALWHIRRVLPDLIQADSNTVGLSSDYPIWVDVDEFLALAELEPLVAADMRRAIDLYQGDLLEGLYDDWVLLERERLWERYLRVLGQLLELEKGVGRYQDALDLALRLVNADPLQESAHREVMRLYFALDRPEAALNQFEACRRILHDEMALTPEPETVALAQEIGRQSAQPDLPYLPPAIIEPDTVLDNRGHDRPLVGRDQARSELLSRAESAVVGLGGLVLVEGQAGIGKTRLLQEVARDTEWRGFQVMWGHCQETAAAPYAPWAQALAAQLTPLRIGQLVHLLESIWLRALIPILPVLAEHLADSNPLPTLEPNEEHQRLTSAFAQLLAAWGQIKPLLLIMEDLHWADEQSMDVLVSLAGEMSNESVLILASYRAEDAMVRPAVWERLQDLDKAGLRHRLILSQLDPAASGELIRICLGMQQAAPVFEQRLYQETGGNPLFILETLQALYDEGVLARDEHGVWYTIWDDTTADYAELPLPRAVEQVISRRLTQLSDPLKRAVQLAAVLGDQFDFSVYRGASGQTTTDLLVALRALVQRRFLQETDRYYRFSHSKVRQVVYSEIPAPACQSMHAQVAHAMAILDEEAVELLAHHFTKANLMERSAHYHFQAGQKARALNIPSTAVVHFDAAVSAAQEAGLSAERQYDLLAARADALNVVGQYEAQEPDLDQMQALAAGDKQKLAEIGRRRARLLAYMSRFGEGERAGREALVLAQEIDDQSAMAAALVALGTIYSWWGKPGEAVPVLEQAVALYHGLNELENKARAQQELGNALLGIKRYRDAESQIQAALASYDELDDWLGQSEQYGILGIIHMEQGQLDTAVEMYQRALELCRAIGFRYGEARNLLNMTNVHYFQGHLGRALDQYDRVVELFQSLGHRRGQAMVRINIASIRLTTLGEIERAKPEAAAALAYYQEVGDPIGEGQCLATLGEIARQEGDLVTATAHMDASLETLLAAGERWIALQVYRNLVLMSLDAGQADNALEQIAAATAICQDLGVPDMQVYFDALQGLALLALGHSEEALTVSLKAMENWKPEMDMSYLVAFWHYQVLDACGHEGKAYQILAQSRELLLACLAGLSPQQQASSLQRVPENRAIIEAWEASPICCIEACLPRVDAPHGRALQDADCIEVVWTIDSPEDREIQSKTSRRRHRILRLLAEAEVQDAVPTIADLAAALSVSTPTIKRDLAALRLAGHSVQTRGRR